MKNKILGIIFFTLGLLGILFLEKIYIEKPFSIDRFIFLLMGVLFLASHLAFGFKKVWNFVYEKRYWIGLILFGYVVFMGYNGSSIYAYNQIIEPAYSIDSSIPIIGNYRAIRSDEYLVDTPSILSQYNHNHEFSPINDALMARNTTVYMFPQLPTKTLSILTSPRLIGFLFLDIERGYSFYWYLPYFILFFGLFELFMILTKNNKMLSLLGTVMLTFSPSLQWWNSTAFLAFGSVATIFFYHLFHTNSKKKKLLYSILLGWMGSCYIMILYPAWQIAYGYLFLGLFIYCIIENKERVRWTDFLYLILAIMTIIILVVPAFYYSLDTIKATMSTVYPGARSSIGGYGWSLYYDYFSSIFYSIYDVGNPCEYSQFLSFYPIPIILGVIKCISNYKNKKNNSLLLILTILGLLLSIWNYIPIGIFSKLTLLSMSTPERAQLIVSVICIFILIELFCSYETKNCSLKRKFLSFIGAGLICTIGIFIDNHSVPDYMNVKMIILSIVIFMTFFYLIFINTKLGNFVFAIMMVILSVFFFVTIHPINKGLGVLLDKPLAKEVQKISAENPSAVWVTIDAPLHLQSYILANGARVLNSTNYYPNLDLWKKFDSDQLNDEVYNRYAHIVLSMTESKTSFELIQSDLFRVYINKNDICKLNIDYIATSSSLEQYNLKNINKIYQMDNILIYQADC